MVKTPVIQIEEADASHADPIAEMVYRSETTFDPASHARQDFAEWMKQAPSLGEHLRRWRSYLSKQPSDERTWLARGRERVVGQMTVEPFKDQYAKLFSPDTSIDAKQRIAPIQYICVDPDYRGLGIGQRLMRVGLQFIYDSGYNLAFLGVEVRNRRARKSYDRFGWRMRGEVQEPNPDLVHYWLDRDQMGGILRTCPE